MKQENTTTTTATTTDDRSKFILQKAPTREITNIILYVFITSDK